MSKYYVTNEQIMEELKKYKENNEMSEKLGKIIIQIMKGLSSKGCFNGYTWKDDMIAEALLTCVKYLKNFDPEKSKNAFAYITKIGYTSFISYIKKEKNHSQIKKVCYEFYEEKMEITHEGDAINYTEIKHIQPKEL